MRVFLRVLQMVTELIHHSSAGKTSSKTNSNSSTSGKPLKGAMKVIKKLKGRIGLGEFLYTILIFFFFCGFPVSDREKKERMKALGNCLLPANSYALHLGKLVLLFSPCDSKAVIAAHDFSFLFFFYYYIHTVYSSYLNFV